MALQPLPNVLFFVGAVVVDNQMQVQFLGCFSLDLFQEPQPFYMGMLLLGASDELAVEVIQCGKQGNRSMPGVVVGLGSNLSHAQRQSRLRALQRLRGFGG